MNSDTLNFRDLGGLPAGDRSIRRGVLFRSEGPRNFVPDRVSTLQEKGFRAIVDLRSSSEREDAPHDWHGPDCHLLGLDVNAGLRASFDEGRERLINRPEPEIAITTMEGTYRDIVSALMPGWPQIARLLLSGSVPMLFNCTAGKDRTGVVIALLLEMIGVPRDVIMQDYRRSSIFGENLVRTGDAESVMIASFGFMPSPAQVDIFIDARKEFLEAAWDEVARQWSDVPSYFEAGGLDSAQQRRLRELLVD